MDEGQYVKPGTPRVGFVMSESLFRRDKRLPEFVDRASGRDRLHMVPQPILSPIYVTCPVRVKWPHRQRLSALMQSAVQAGLFRYYEGMLAEEHARSLVKEVVPSDAPQALGLSAMLEALVALCGGVALAGTAFLAERFAQRRGRRVRDA
ncbi:Protein of unknown function [Gryllus bimaculatus]|nr:Protein of unknown function [Gryllus bimaculatus]